MHSQTFDNQDPKPLKRIRDKELLAVVYLLWRECALCRANDQLSLHHISKHPRDDVIGNLVMLCGHGTAGCHGLIEAHDEATMRKLGEYVLRSRGDTIAYIYSLNDAVQAQDWLRRHLFIAS